MAPTIHPDSTAVQWVFTKFRKQHGQTVRDIRKVFLSGYSFQYNWNMNNSCLKGTAVRLLILFAGLAVAHLGVTLFLLADLGADPFNVLIQGLRLSAVRAGVNLTHGTMHMCVCFLIILCLLIIDRSYIRAGTIVCMIFGGPIIDAYTLLLQNLGIGTATLAVKIGVLILGCTVLAFGMTVVIQSKAGTGPNDLVAVVISDKTRIRFGIVRIATDLFFVMTGFLLGGKIGIGTLICAFLVGAVADFCMPLSALIVKKVLACARIPS